jgi:NADPH-dependent 2,4-dienoyl-CoA reductase/sulfur reductase-like enzyme
VKIAPDTFRDKYDIDVRTLHEVTAIDLAQRQLTIRLTDTGEEALESFDQLVIATGSSPIRPPVPGITSDGVFGVSEMEEGLRLRKVLDQGRPRRAVIVGGGYIGVEMAEALLRRGLEVAIVDMLPEVMGTLDEDMGAIVSDALRKAGVGLYLGETLKEFEIDGSHVRAVVTDRRSLPADIAILGMGVRPNSRLAEAAGIPVGVKKAIRVDEKMQTEAEGIWAVGDCVESFHIVSKRPFYVAIGTVANKQGRVAGINIGGGSARFQGVVGTALTKFKDLEIARTGLQETEAGALGLDYVSAKVENPVRSGYWPEAGRVTIKMVAEKSSGRLLGSQIVGSEGSGKRIDTLATALHAGMTVEDILGLDLGYAPPYSGAWDSILIAARQTHKLLAGSGLAI